MLFFFSAPSLSFKFFFSNFISVLKYKYIKTQHGLLSPSQNVIISTILNKTKKNFKKKTTTQILVLVHSYGQLTRIAVVTDNQQQANCEFMKVVLKRTVCV